MQQCSAGWGPACDLFQSTKPDLYLPVVESFRPTPRSMRGSPRRGPGVDGIHQACPSPDEMREHSVGTMVHCIPTGDRYGGDPLAHQLYRRPA